jgi:hypothetical protein
VNNMMRKTILVAAIALLASGVALADNASSTYAGFTATAADGMHLAADGTPVLQGTNSTGVNTGFGVGDAFAGVAGYYGGIAASAIPAPGVTANTGGTYNLRRSKTKVGGEDRRVSKGFRANRSSLQDSIQRRLN